MHILLCHSYLCSLMNVYSIEMDERPHKMNFVITQEGWVNVGLGEPWSHGNRCGTRMGFRCLQTPETGRSRISLLPVIGLYVPLHIDMCPHLSPIRGSLRASAQVKFPFPFISSCPAITWNCFSVK